MTLHVVTSLCFLLEASINGFPLLTINCVLRRWGDPFVEEPICLGHAPHLPYDTYVMAQLQQQHRVKRMINWEYWFTWGIKWKTTIGPKWSSSWTKREPEGKLWLITWFGPVTITLCQIKTSLGQKRHHYKSIGMHMTRLPKSLDEAKNTTGSDENQIRPVWP